MFWNNQKENNQKEKELLRKEWGLEWREEKITDLEKFNEVREERKSNILVLDIELAKRQAERDYKIAENEKELRFSEEKFAEILAEKERIITRQDEEIKVLLAMLPKVDLTKFNISCNCDGKSK